MPAGQVLLVTFSFVLLLACLPAQNTVPKSASIWKSLEATDYSDSASCTTPMLLTYILEALAFILM